MKAILWRARATAAIAGGPAEGRGADSMLHLFYQLGIETLDIALEVPCLEEKKK